MRFKRGRKVEVIKMTQSPASRRRGEILSDNGHMYTVRYDYYHGTESRGRIDRVSRKNIRSCTPSVEGLENQEIGQVVEVFDESSWKTATIVKVLDRDCYLVRQTGCLKELCVHRSNTRVVQCWQDEERDLIRKEYGLCRRPDQLSALNPSNKGNSWMYTSFASKSQKMMLAFAAPLLALYGGSYNNCPQIRQFMAFVVIAIKLHDLFCLDNFDIGLLFAES